VTGPGYLRLPDLFRSDGRAPRLIFARASRGTMLHESNFRGINIMRPLPRLVLHANVDDGRCGERRFVGRQTACAVA
jgi:hypothetical protein